MAIIASTAQRRVTKNVIVFNMNVVQLPHFVKVTIPCCIAQLQLLRKGHYADAIVCSTGGQDQKEEKQSRESVGNALLVLRSCTFMHQIGHRHRQQTPRAQK